MSIFWHKIFYIKFLRGLAELNQQTLFTHTFVVGDGGASALLFFCGF